MHYTLPARASCQPSRVFIYCERFIISTQLNGGFLITFSSLKLLPLISYDFAVNFLRFRHYFLVPQQTPKSNKFAANYVQFRRYILMISPLASYDFAANKLMFSQLFPYIPLFNLCTGYILTISPLASYVFAAILAPIT